MRRDIRRQDFVRKVLAVLCLVLGFSMVVAPFVLAE